MDSGLTTVLTTTMTTVPLPDTSTYTTSELVLCLVAPQPVPQKVGGSNPFGRAQLRGAVRHCVSTAHLEPRSRFRGEVDRIGLGEIGRSSHRGPLAIFGEEEFVLAYRAFDGVHAER